ncbi:glyoxalase [Burkholderia ubonensis]|uniref:Glyoxalase n=1 Tax=Burkholderia ubonensis TaxID=101571 RepID=A0A103QKI8_9BURK|nr:VOC family protein [Burkholderia ubonensis]AOJ67116.1 glyoxalase [Burkholderia ubonensis]KVG51103.1 glyoxalase [Burkholderia ubonensis]
MFSHICVGVSDLARAYDFYAPLCGALGLRLKFREPDGWCGWMPADADRPLFFIGQPLDGGPPAPGNGHTIAFDAATRELVDRCHALALQRGGTCEGPPGLRPHYHPDYYGAYFRDPDGNKLCVVCHRPE